MANTHMGVSPQNHVLLLPQEFDVGLRFVRVDARGDPGDGEEFVVPNGKFLVVTDVDWSCSAGPPESMQTLRVIIAENRTAFESTVILNHQGSGGASEAMTSGFVVASGVILTVDIVPGAHLDAIIIRGYLCRAS
jgi:hypothetical protein